ncbi:MAG TPA: twin-arginine translocation pathway signal protein, partial [Chryseosolibacter sp.]
MRRRKAVKAIALGAVTPGLFFPDTKENKRDAVAGRQYTTFESPWSQWPDMPWVGPEFWGNRLQDWRIEAGRAVCVVTDRNRTLHWLTCQLSKEAVAFETSVVLEWLNTDDRSAGNRAGFLLGAKGKFDDYRSAAVFGEGFHAGADGAGRLYLGDAYGERILGPGGKIRLVLRAVIEGGAYTLRLTGESADSGKTLGELVAPGIPLDALQGTIALRSDFQPSENSRPTPSVAFERWTLSGAKVIHDTAHSFGPVCFAHYTLNRKVLKLTAQLAPVESIGGYKVALQLREGNGWRTLKESSIDPLGRTAHFRVDGWLYQRTVSYRIRVELPLKGAVAEYFYEGEIAREPLENRRVKMAVFSCNCDYGFPDSDVPRHVGKHKPNLAVFLGDQFYESTGGFRIETSPPDRACLDYLRKWYMFGWSYRDIFRNIPSVCIPDDHDVYHGNVWGEGGKKAPTDGGWGYEAQ